MPVRIVSRPPRVSFLHRNVQPPTGIYIHRDDVLIVRVMNSVTDVVVRVEARLLDPLGTVRPQRFDIRPAATRTVETSVFDMSEGFLLGLAVFPDEVVTRRGQCFVELSLGRGSSSAFTILHHLTSDYVSDNGRMGWPGGRIVSSIEGPGIVRRVTLPDPPAGINFGFTVPIGARWLFRSMRAILVTDGTAANRRVGIDISPDVGNNLFENLSPSVQVASTGRAYNFPTTGWAQAEISLNHWVPVPLNTLLLAGWAIQVFTENLQPGDNWGAPDLWVEEWLEA